MNSSWGYGKQFSFIYFGCWIALKWMPSRNSIVGKYILIDTPCVVLNHHLVIVEFPPLDAIQSDALGVICLN